MRLARSRLRVLPSQLLPLLLVLFAACVLIAPAAQTAAVTWKQCLGQAPAWYAGAEAVRIAEAVLRFQRDSGGWPKNIDMAAPLSTEEQRRLLQERSKKDSTIDNGATTRQIIYLARVHNATREARFRDACLKGLDYLLAAQYPNGGWPQFFPEPRGYAAHITFNDDAMVNVMRLLRDVAGGSPEYAFVDNPRRQRVDLALAKAVDCILKCQIEVRGRRTVWCAQHDEQTLAPAPARVYEKASLSGSESIGIVRFLMAVQRPEPRIVDAIEAAVTWFQESKLTGIRQMEKPDPSLPGGRDKVIVPDAGAGPLWARFYEIETNRPIFCGRDGATKYSLAEIEHERRAGYGWYTGEPARLLNEDYPKWRELRVQVPAVPADNPSVDVPRKRQ